MPESMDRGRKRHACDECSRLKVKCDSQMPCRKCMEFGRNCVKTHHSGELVSAGVDAPANHLRIRRLVASHVTTESRDVFALVPELATGLDPVDTSQRVRV